MIFTQPNRWLHTYCARKKDLQPPCVGMGHIAEVLKQCGYNVKCSDIIDRGYTKDIKLQDFLEVDIPNNKFDIITNPPYDLDTVGSKENNISKTFANCNRQITPIGGV